MPCRTETGDHLVESGLADHPTVMKIDVEGYEREVLQGLRKVLASERTTAVVFEGPDEDYATRELSPFGFKIAKIGGRAFEWLAIR